MLSVMACVVPEGALTITASTARSKVMACNKEAWDYRDTRLHFLEDI